MSYIQLPGLHTMDLRDPSPDSVDIIEIAASLAHINRFTGHAGAYSVAQHSVLGSHFLKSRGYPEIEQLAFLMHDAHEAYTGDVTSPVKRELGDAWTAFETKHAVNVANWLGLDPNTPIVREMDAAICCLEADTFLGGRVGAGWPSPDFQGEPLRESIRQWQAEEAFKHFITRVIELDPSMLSSTFPRNAHVRRSLL